MKNVDFSFAAREDSKETTAQIGDENSPRRQVPACTRPASKAAASAGQESPPPSPRSPAERRQPRPPPFEHNAQAGEAEAGSAWPQPDSACSGRERLKRHRDEVAGRVLIPDSWGQESFLKDWMDCSAFDTLLAPKGLASAREALMAEGGQRRATSHQRVRIEGRC